MAKRWYSVSVLSNFEKKVAEAIRQALRDNAGDARATIEALGIPRKTFYDKLQRHGIARRDFGSASDED